MFSGNLMYDQSHSKLLCLILLYFCCHYRAGSSVRNHKCYILCFDFTDWTFKSIGLPGCLAVQFIGIHLNCFWTLAKFFKCYFKSWFPKLIKHWKACGICNVDDAVHKVCWVWQAWNYECCVCRLTQLPNIFILWLGHTVRDIWATYRQ